MKRFRFKLENVMKYRITLEELAKNNYREAMQNVNLEKQRLAELEQNRDNLMTAYNDQIKPGAVIHHDNINLIARYTYQLAFLIDTQHNNIAQKEEIAREKFREWNEKRKDVKVMERLKEKKWNEYLKEIDKEDQQFQDEIFLAKTIREQEAGE